MRKDRGERRERMRLSSRVSDPGRQSYGAARDESQRDMVTSSFPFRKVNRSPRL